MSVIIAIVSARGQPTHQGEVTGAGATSPRNSQTSGARTTILHVETLKHLVHMTFPTSRHNLGIVFGAKVHSGMNSFINFLEQPIPPAAAATAPGQL